MTPVEPSPACFALIKRYEGCRLSAYQDVAGIWSVGWGHTGPDIGAKTTINQTWADWLLKQDVHKAAVAVRSLTIGTELTQGQLDALTSFVYNEGAHALKESTLLRKFRLGDVGGAAAEFEKWVFAGVPPVERAGLKDRRKAERRMFLGGAA